MEDPRKARGSFEINVPLLTRFQVKVRRGQVYVEEAKIIDGDIMATNGVIQVIDKVLL